MAGPFRFVATALGSPLRFQVQGGTLEAASSAWALVRAEFAAVDAALSRHRDDSELTALNRVAATGCRRPVGARLFTAIAATDRAWRLTDGRFDARVLADLEQLGDHGAPLGDPPPAAGEPPPAAVHPSAAVAGRGPWRDPRTRSVALDSPHDLGGIGKGLALRWAARRASAVLGQTTGFLLESGGDIVVRGRPRDQASWSIAVEDPGLDHGPIAVVSVAAGAICTSSIARRRWQAAEGRSVHHLIDPRTGEPGGDGLRAVTVAGSDPAWAEVWSKALFLEGQRRIGEAARARGLAAWWVEVDGALRMTPAGRADTIWTRDEGLGP